MNQTDEQELDALSNRGLEFYERTLKAKLELPHRGEYVAIHVESEDYALGTTSGGAMRAIRASHPQGHVVVLKMGGEPEWGPAARVLGQQMVGGRATTGLLANLHV